MTVDIKQDASIGTYPSHQVDPREKGYSWILQYTRAAYKDARGIMPLGFTNNGILKTSEIKLYTLAKQPVDKYKKLFSPGSGPSDESWRAIDWTPLGLMCKYREIALSIISKQKYDISAYAIDPIAKSEEDDYFNRMKVKILMRQAAEQAGQDVSNNPVLAPQPGEPFDLEELQMQKDSGYKHQMAIEAENAVNLILQQNNGDQLLREIDQSLYDFGIAGLTTDIDENGMVKLRAINREMVGFSYCEKQDFSDLIHWFEIVPTYVGDLAPYYTKDQLDTICKQALNKYGNPTQYFPVSGYFNQSWNKFKVMVLKIRFLSWNDTIYKNETDSAGNQRFMKSSYDNRQFLSVNQSGKLEGEMPASGNDFFESISETGTQGAPTPKYLKETSKVVYKADWVIDTEFMHNYGVKENQNRKLSSWWDTDLDLYVFAPNFYKMQYSGISEKLIPLEDRANMLWFNLQNLSNKIIPYLISIDLTSVEAVNFGKTGQAQAPSDIINFIYSNFVVPWRSNSMLNRNPNYKPVSIEASGQLAAFAQLYEQLDYTVNLMRQVSGLNELTDASTPNPKTLVPVAQAAIESTNNSIYRYIDAKKDILRRTADGIVQKVQIAVKLGKVEGYAKALGNNSVQFFRINPDISLHELGIFIDDAPTDVQRQALWQDITLKESQGYLDISDKYFIMTCRNLSQAVQVLSYRIEKRKQQEQQNALQLQQQRDAGQQQIAQQAQEAEVEKEKMLAEIEIEKIGVEKQWDYIIEMAKKNADFNEAQVQAQAKAFSASVQANAKVMASHIAAKNYKKKGEK